MLPVSALSLGVLALSAPVVAVSESSQQIYTEWKQSSYYNQAVQVVNTVGGTAAGSFTSAKNVVSISGSGSSAVDVSVGSLESNETMTFPPPTGSAGSSSSSVVTTITETEEQQRFDQALAAIAELQSLHPHANFSINTPFALLTSEEFLAYVNRYAVDPASNPVKAGTSSTAGMFTADAGNSSSAITSSSSGDIRTSSAGSGETVDWQEAGCVTAVKDQGECGACWAFSATAAMESGYCVATGGSLPSLSDQQLISCDGEDGNSGCGGGYAAYTMDWVANERSGKMCTLDSYPFTSDDGNVPSCSMSSCTEFDVGVTGYDSVREDAGAIEDAVRKQPVSIFLYSGSSAFQYYSGGVLTGENCDKTGSHSALAVGFGETEDNVLYWRIKNQWGTSWGEDGYVRVQRRYSGDSEGACGVEMYATWPTFDVSASSAPSVTTPAPSVTTSAPSVTTPAPAVTTSAPSVTTATPTSTPSAALNPTKPAHLRLSDEALARIVIATTPLPSVTKAAPVTDTPSATKTAPNTVDHTEPVASSASGSDLVIQNETVDQVSASSGSTRLYEAVTSDASTVEDASNYSTTPSLAQSDSVVGDASYASDTTPSPTMPSVVVNGAGASTPSTGKRDCVM